MFWLLFTFGQARRHLEPYIHPLGVKLTKEEKVQRAFLLLILIICVMIRIKKKAPKLYNTFICSWMQRYSHKTAAQLLSVQHLC